MHASRVGGLVRGAVIQAPVKLASSGEGNPLEIRLLGTGASEGYPALACACDHCRTARELGGRNLRKRSHALVDDQLLIDLGPDLLWASQQYHLQLNRLPFVLLTHGDGDHLFMSNLTTRKPPFASGDVTPWQLWGSAASLAPVAELPRFDELRLQLHPVAAFDTFAVGPYTVTALKANHAPTKDALFYAIQRGAAALLYATDSGAWGADTWATLEALGRSGVRFGVAVIEATYGVNHERSDRGHMSLQDVAEHATGLRQCSLLLPNATITTTHHAHAGVPPHAEMEALLTPQGITPGYDGMVLRMKD